MFNDLDDNPRPSLQYRGRPTMLGVAENPADAERNNERFLKEMMKTMEPGRRRNRYPALDPEIGKPKPASPPPEAKPPTGAVRSGDGDDLKLTLISPIALFALARTYGEGVKYGEYNWERGMSIRSLLEHALRHVFLFLAGDRSEPHLAHAAWNLMGAVHSEVAWPHLNQDLRGPGCTLTAGIVAKLDREAAELTRKRKAGFFAKLGLWLARDLPEIKTIMAVRGPAQPAGPGFADVDNLADPIY